jgi:FAD/FMN-containing dehydrogenase
MVDRRPRAIARCVIADDVADAVRYGLSAASRSGFAAAGTACSASASRTAGLMIDLNPMCAVRVDPERRRARVQGGALLGALDRAAMAHGLATTAGNVSHTGVGGALRGARCWS